MQMSLLGGNESLGKVEWYHFWVSTRGSGNKTRISLVAGHVIYAPKDMPRV